MTIKLSVIEKKIISGISGLSLGLFLGTWFVNFNLAIVLGILAIYTLILVVTSD